MKLLLFAVAALAAAGLHADAGTRFIIDTRSKGAAQYEAVQGEGLVTFGLTGSQPDNPNRQWVAFKVGAEPETRVAEFKALADCRLSFMVGLEKKSPDSLAVTSFKVNGRELLANADISLKNNMPAGFTGPRDNQPKVITAADGAKSVVFSPDQYLRTNLKMQAGETYRVEVTMAAVK